MSIKDPYIKSDVIEVERQLLEKYIEDRIKIALLNPEKYYNSYTQAVQQPPMTAAEVQQQQYAQIMIANQFSNQFNAAVQQQLLQAASAHLGHFAQTAAKTVIFPPYKEHDLGQYMLIRDAGVWTLRHKPCIQKISPPKKTWLSNSTVASSTNTKFNVVDEDGVCSGCGGVADEAILMQLNLRMLERE